MLASSVREGGRVECLVIRSDLPPLITHVPLSLIQLKIKEKGALPPKSALIFYRRKEIEDDLDKHECSREHSGISVFDISGVN